MSKNEDVVKAKTTSADQTGEEACDVPTDYSCRDKNVNDEIERQAALETTHSDITVDTKPKLLGAKFDQGKLQYSLIPPEATRALAQVLTFGANKYAPNSWKHVPEAKRRYLDALMRHLEAFRGGETNDPESGFNHLDHVLANAAFLVTLASYELPTKG